ncbi:MAG: hypothetical protein H6717_15515 [Polyangiaceae bacterium]|nr:hypothetical protein [Polyangiaceae bacterium]
MASAEEKRDLKARFDAQLDDLQQMRDEIRVKLHLAGMDAKDVWREMEPKLEKLERDASEEGENIADATLALAKNLSEAVRKFRDRL